MEDKQNFFIWHGLTVNRLAGPGLMSLWMPMVGASVPISLVIT